MKVITLTTDFGTRDWFVGTMKGVILGIAPETRLVDLTHEVPTGDIRAGAFALKCACAYFPAKTIHVVVVDPGVGSTRSAIAIRTDKYVFVGPDNGALSWAVANQRIRSVRRIENSKWMLPEMSRTFHGRDVFAPVAAHLSNGGKFRQLGPRQKDFVRFQWPEPTVFEKGIRGEVIYIDRFGNAITNIPAHGYEASAESLVVTSGRKRVCHVREFYQAAPAGRPVAIFGSTGFLEIAVNRGHAATQLHLRPGSKVALAGE